MDPRATSGGQLVLGVIVATVVVSATTFLHSLPFIVNILRREVVLDPLEGARVLALPTVGVLLTAGLGVFLYRRAKWARWAAGMFFGLQSATYLVTGVGLATGPENVPMTPYFLGVGLLY
ncbi:MAG: hypothetical protein QF886_18505, partial [Planctomycetota bacterium]|nr:hypothetical protein [Planctomycetota bacterium]